MSNDTDPAFMAEFYTNIKILNQDLYKKTTVAATAPGTSGGDRDRGGARPSTSTIHRPMSSSVGNSDKPGSRLLSRGDSHRNMLSRGASHSNLAHVGAQGKQPSASHLTSQEGPQSQGQGQGRPVAATEYFTAQHMQDRVRQYAAEAGIPADYLERYSQEAAAGSATTPAKGGGVGAGAGTPVKTPRDPKNESLKRLMAEEN
jgi:hypothetical protein